MTDADWPHILHLLGDSSPRVQEVVRERLRSLGHDPLFALEEIGIELNTPQRHAVIAWRRELSQDHIDRLWERWEGDSRADLESFHVLISLLLAEEGGYEDPRLLLDRWASRYRERHEVPDLTSLLPFLFSPERMQGDMDDYFAPRNSSLTWCLAHHTGMPITLACALILIARRLGILVSGVAFPGHFLARAEWEGQTVWIDCFDNGRLIPPRELQQAVVALPPRAREMVLGPASNLEICARILRNVSGSLEKIEDVERKRKVDGWLEQLEERLQTIETPGLE